MEVNCMHKNTHKELNAQWKTFGIVHTTNFHSSMASAGAVYCPRSHAQAASSPAYSREVSRAVRRQKSKFSEYQSWPHFSPGPGAWCPDQTLYTEAEHNGDCVETVWRLCVDADCFYEFLIYYLRPLTAAAAPPRSDNLFLWII